MCRNADKVLVETLFSKELDINNSLYNGYNCLQAAIDQNLDNQNIASKILLLLIKVGADLSSNNTSRTSPLHYACNTGNITILMELLSRMSEVDFAVKSSICALLSMRLLSAAI